jgi:hypothetical protein
MVPISADTMEPSSSNARLARFRSKLRNQTAHQQRPPIERQKQQRIRGLIPNLRIRNSGSQPAMDHSFPN